MKGETKERWMHLCDLAADEQNPAKLLALITEINDLLGKKEARLKVRQDEESSHAQRDQFVD
jgi:hypothetical protein